MGLYDLRNTPDCWVDFDVPATRDLPFMDAAWCQGDLALATRRYVAVVDHGQGVLFDAASIEWMRAAACVDVTDVDFLGPSWKAALRICHGCPVRRECLDYAIEYRMVDGIWGGTTGPARTQLMRRANAIAA